MLDRSDLLDAKHLRRRSMCCITSQSDPVFIKRAHSAITAERICILWSSGHCAAVIVIREPALSTGQSAE